MGKHSLSTQARHPWRATARTLLAALVGVAAMAAPVYTAITGQSPEAAAGWTAVGLAIAGAVTRVLALPQVDDWLHLFVPWLATGGRFDGYMMGDEDNGSID